MDNLILDIGYQPPQKKSILVVDDETAIQSTMFDTFVDDFKIFSAHNGREGLSLAEKVKPDLIVLDVMMPDLNGLEVLQYLKANSVTKAIPVIVTTAKGFNPAVIEAIKREPNVVGFIAKPFHVKEMRDIVKKAFEKFLK